MRYSGQIVSGPQHALDHHGYSEIAVQRQHCRSTADRRFDYNRSEIAVQRQQGIVGVREARDYNRSEIAVQRQLFEYH